MRIGILQTDTVMARFRASHGDYPDMFTRLLNEAAEGAATFDSFAVTQSDLPAPERCDGYVITGSRQSVYDPDPWIAELAGFTDRVRATGRAVVGICFGHQLIAHFGGGRCDAAANGWAVGVHRSDIVAQQPWMTPAADEIRLISSHKDQVTQLPNGARLFASNSHCPIAGYVIDDQVLCLQGHPEFSRPYSADLMTMRRDLLGEDVYQAGIASLDGPTTEPLVARWIIRFLQSGVLSGTGH